MILAPFTVQPVMLSTAPFQHPKLTGTENRVMQSVRAGGATYKLELRSKFFEENEPKGFFRIYRNDRRLVDLWTYNPYFPDHDFVRLVRWPFRGCLLVARRRAASSERTWYHLLDGHGLTGSMAELNSGMNGGPVYRDLDGDGRPEMMFDDFSYYLDYLDHHRLKPQHLLIYKVDYQGRMSFWKRIQNHRRERLPNTLGAIMGDHAIPLPNAKTPR